MPPLFLSAASLVEIEAVIDRVRGRDTKRAEGLQAWLDGLVTTFSDRIHPIDIHVAVEPTSAMTRSGGDERGPASWGTSSEARRQLLDRRRR
jgi:hypothetical protein